MDFRWLIDYVVPWGGSCFSANPWMSGAACLWQPSLVPGEGSAACPCLPHTELKPGCFAGRAKPRCRPGTRMWTPLRPPAGETRLFQVACGCWQYGQEVSGYRWLRATATECLWGCLDWKCRICHKLWEGNSQRGLHFITNWDKKGMHNIPR